MLTRTVARTLAVTVSMAMVVLGAGLEAESAGATTPPAVVGASITPSTVTVTSASATLNVLVHATSPSGIEEIDVELDSPGFNNGTGSGQSFYESFSGGALPMPSGSGTDGTWSLPVTIPVGAASGTWTLGTVAVMDATSTVEYTGYPENVDSGTLLIPGGAPTLQVNDTAPDTTGPSLAGTTITPSSVDVSSAGGAVGLDLHLTDPAGVQYVSADLIAPSGAYYTSIFLDEVNSTPTNDHWATSIDVPQEIENGTWSIANLSVQDSLSNSSSPTPSPHTYVVSGGTPGVPDAPDSVSADSYGTGGFAEVSWIEPDVHGSPVTTYSLEYSTNGGTNWSAPVSFLTSANQGAYYDFNGLAPGTYVFQVEGTNVAGTSSWSAPSSPLVVTAPDTQNPVLTAVGVSPTSVDVSSADKTVNVTVTATDDTSLFGAFVQLDAPGGAEYVTASVSGPPTTGTATSGSWVLPVTIPSGSIAGSWTLGSVEVDDQAGNTSDYGPDFGGAAYPNVPPAIAVTDSNPDTTAPAFGTATITPSTSVNVAGGDQSVTVTVPITDARSGLDSNSVNFSAYSPSGQLEPLTWTTYPYEVSGTPASSTWSGTFALPHHAIDGSWSVRAEAADRVGNDSGLVTPAGSTFTVSGGAAAAPAATDFIGAQQDGPGSLDVYWDVPYDNGAAITGYTLQSSTNAGATWSAVPLAPGTSTDVVVSGLDSTKSYIFQVAATNMSGTGAWSGSSYPVSPLPAAATVPGAPTSVGAVPGDGSATVSWTAPASNGGSAITGYKVERSSDGGSSWTTVSSSTPSSPLAVTGLTNGTGYLFRVSAQNALGYGAATSTTSAVTPVPSTPPAVPTGFSAVRGNASVALTWSASSGATSYDVQYSPDGTTWTQVAPSPTGTSTTVSGLANGTTYEFQVRAVNGAGSSAWSASTPATPAAIPGAPTGVSGARGDGQASLTWALPGGTLTAVRVEQSTNGGTSWSPATTGALTGTATSTTVTGLSNGTSYVFRVIATNAAGDGPPSAASAAVTPAGLPVAASTPTASGGSGTVALSWTLGSANGASITSVTVQQSTDGASWNSLAPLAGNATSTTVSGLANGTSYSFRIVETNAVGSSTSGVASATPTAPVVTPPAPASAAAPVIVGTPKAGKAVSVAVTLPSGVTVTYKWVLTVKKGSKKSAKTVGTGASLKLKKTWKKGKLQLVVTFSAPGQPSSVRTILVSGKLK